MASIKLGKIVRQVDNYTLEYQTDSGQLEKFISPNRLELPPQDITGWLLSKETDIYGRVKAVVETPSHKNEMLGLTIPDTFTNSFNMKVYPQAESKIFELGFVTIRHEERDFIGQVTRLRRTAHYHIAEVQILSETPKTPFLVGEYVYPAPDAMVMQSLEMDSAGLYIGTMFKHSIKFMVPMDALFDGTTVIGGKNSGKTSVSFTLAEEITKKPKIVIAILILDIFGEAIFKFPSKKAEELVHFGLKPQTFPNLFISFQSEINPFTDMEIDVNDLHKDEFYRKILQPGIINTISMLGLSADEKQTAVAEIARRIRQLGLRGEIPPTLVILDEAQNFMREGHGRDRKGTETHQELMDLSTEAAHANIMMVHIGQRKSFMSKDVIAHNNNWIALRMKEVADLERLPEELRNYSGLLGTVPKATAIVNGFMPFTTMVKVRERQSMVFGKKNPVMAFFKKECQEQYTPQTSWQQPR